MGLFVTVIIILLISYFYYAKSKKTGPLERKKLLFKSILYFLIGVVIALALSGRISWIIAAGAALIPVVKFIFLFLLRGFPLIQMWMRSRESRKDGGVASQKNNTLSQTEAWEILGLEPGSSDEEIIMAHKKLMQKLHPDRGGSNYMATKLNLARDLLLERKG
jgi:ABC-type multidrug transport system fused ATPase/permease subunit